MGGYLEEVGQALMGPLSDMGNTVANKFLAIIAAIVVLIIGYIVASAFGFLVKKILEKSKVDDHLKKAGLAHSIGFLSISTLLGGLVKWGLFIAFLGEAAKIVNLDVITNLLTQLARWFPSLVVAIAVFLVGLVLADFAADRVLHAKRKGMRLLSGLVRWVIIVFVSLIALDQIGVDVYIASTTAFIIIGSIAFGVALAFGLGFGFAFRDEAKGIIKKVKKNI
ncbi:MAG: hypothetical protein GY861_06415 [bacterium]|nr:hypothetical protein [bacterium]